jgi:hypothetical protein
VRPKLYPIFTTVVVTPVVVFQHLRRLRPHKPLPWRFFAPKHIGAGIFPVAPRSFLSWKRFSRPRIKRRWRLTRSIRAYPFQFQMVGGFATAATRYFKPRALAWVVRRKLYPIFTAAPAVVWKRFPRPKIRRRWRLTRAKVYPIVAAVAPPPVVIWKRPPRFRIRRGKVSILAFLRRKYPIVAAVASPIVVWKRAQRPRIHRARININAFLRARKSIPSQIVLPSSLSWKRPPSFKIRRAPNRSRLMTMHKVFPGVPPTPPPPVGQFTVSGPGVVDLFDPVTGVNYTWSPTQRRTL